MYRPKIQSDILDPALNASEKAILALLKQNPKYSREEIAERISKTVRTVQRALDSLKEKGYIKRSVSALKLSGIIRLLFEPIRI